MLACAAAIDLVFVLDTIGVFGNTIEYMAMSLRFVKEILLRMTISEHDTRVGLVALPFKEEHVFHLNKYNDLDGVLYGLDDIVFYIDVESPAPTTKQGRLQFVIY